MKQNLNNFMFYNGKCMVRYKGNDFNVADIKLWKNGNTLFATLKKCQGNETTEDILEKWVLPEFKNKPIY